MQQIQQSEYSLETIRYCQQNFTSILPKKQICQDRQIPVQEEFTINQIKQIMEQYNTLLQLVIQNILHCKDKHLNQRNNDILDFFRLQNNDFGPLCQVDLQEFYPKSSSTSFYMPQQTKITQDPLLYLPMDQLKSIGSIEKLVPLINVNYVPAMKPTKDDQKNSRVSLCQIDSQLLYQGLKLFGKDFKNIKENILNSKTAYQVKIKYKNLSVKMAEANKVKDWKQLSYSYLTSNEVDQLIKGMNRFQQRFHLIQKYFLPERSAQFLQQDFNKCPLLQKKRNKHQLLNEPSYYLPLRQKSNEPSFPKQQQIIESSQSPQVKFDFDQEYISLSAFFHNDDNYEFQDNNLIGGWASFEVDLEF